MQGTKAGLDDQMDVMNSEIICALCGAAMTCFPLSPGAKDVSIPDPELNAGIRQALQEPGDPLTEQDLLSVTSPTNELHRQPNEGPQTVVTLIQGFWIGEVEVAGGEYVSVMSTAPGSTPRDLSRPVSSVSWFDATPRCWNLANTCPLARA